jgi:hypothetical protein
MSRGASIAFLSVYPDEREILYPPLTYLRPLGQEQIDVGGKLMKCISVEPYFPSA